MAAASELKIKGTTHELTPGLYVGQLDSVDSEPLYFGFEELNRNNKPFWDYHGSSVYSAANVLRKFCKIVGESGCPEYPNEFSEYFSYDEVQYSKILKHIQQNPALNQELNWIDSSRYQLGSGPSPTGTTHWRFGKAYSDVRAYMVYLSKVPITQPHVIDKETIKSRAAACDYRTRCVGINDHIVLSFVFQTSLEVPTASHYGFLKNPVNLLSSETKHSDSSRIDFMKVHGFAAAVALNHFKTKKWMVTRSLTDEISLFSKSLHRDEMHIGTNNTEKKHSRSISFLNKERARLINRHPPIWHIDPETHVKKIAKMGLESFQKSRSLPDADAEYIAPAKHWINFAPPDQGRLKVVIRFETLATYFLEGRETKS